MKKQTGLTDDYGTPINDGDTIEWTYKQHGVMIKNEDGTERFLPCVTSSEMSIKEFKERRKITHEIRNEISGYFLDRPNGVGTTFVIEKPKCRVVS